MKRLLLPVLAGLLAVGCVGTHIKYPTAPERALNESAGRPISAEATGFQLLLWIPIGVNERHENCWEELKAKAPGEFITDIRIQDTWTYALIGTIYTVRMEAMADRYASE